MLLHRLSARCVRRDIPRSGRLDEVTDDVRAVSWSPALACDPSPGEKHGSVLSPCDSSCCATRCAIAQSLGERLITSSNEILVPVALSVLRRAMLRALRRPLRRALLCASCRAARY